MSNLSKQAILEIHDLTGEARRLAVGSGADRKAADVVLARIANIRAAGISTVEMQRTYSEALLDNLRGTAAETRAAHEAAFRRMFCAANHRAKNDADAEYRDLQAGQQSISYTNGLGGGYLVPQVFYNDVVTAMAQTDPLLDPDTVDLIQEPGYAMHPKTIPGYDLTSISATRVDESTNGQDAVPTVSGKLLNGWIYKLAINGSLEIEQDDFEQVSKTMSRAYGVGFARGIGADLVNGTGSSQPGGLLTGAANSGVTTGAAGVLTADDFNAVFFSVNRVYRNSPKCAWVLNDATYELVRKAKDSNNRPLLSMSADFETLMGKPVLVSPSMPSGAGSKGIVFGDLSHFHVRLSAMWFIKALEVAAGVEYGRANYIARVRADATVFDPASASSPVTGTSPIQYATLHS